MNRHEQFVHDVILMDFPEVIWQQLFRTDDQFYVVDFYSPAHHLAFEIDGRWHQTAKQEYDKERSAWLLEHHNLPVVRLTHEEIEELMEVAA